MQILMCHCANLYLIYDSPVLSSILESGSDGGGGGLITTELLNAYV